MSHRGDCDQEEKCCFHQRAFCHGLTGINWLTWKYQDWFRQLRTCSSPHIQHLLETNTYPGVSRWQTWPDPQLPDETVIHSSNCNMKILFYFQFSPVYFSFLLKDPLKQMTIMSIMLAVTPRIPRLVSRKAETFWSSVQINLTLK